MTFLYSDVSALVLDGMSRDTDARTQADFDCEEKWHEAILDAAFPLRTELRAEGCPYRLRPMDSKTDSDADSFDMFDDLPEQTVSEEAEMLLRLVYTWKAQREAESLIASLSPEISTAIDNALDGIKKALLDAYFASGEWMDSDFRHDPTIQVPCNYGVLTFGMRKEGE